MQPPGNLTRDESHAKSGNSVRRLLADVCQQLELPRLTNVALMFTHDDNNAAV